MQMTGNLSYVAMCIDLNEMFLFLILLRENLTAGRKKKNCFVCLTMLIHDHQMCMRVLLTYLVQC